VSTHPEHRHPGDGERAAISESDLGYLARAVDLAEIALDAGDEPFGSLLVDAAGEVLFEDHNHVSGGDHTRHPELAIALWAVAHLSAAERKRSTVYTSGEHCPMCAAAHGWVGLGRIVYAASSAQLSMWRSELGVPDPAVAALPIRDVVPSADVQGPAPSLAERVRLLHVRASTELDRGGAGQGGVPPLNG